MTGKWLAGKGTGIQRLFNTIFDKERTEWLPIWCFVIEHPEGIIVVDTGISTNANDPIYFPPYMPFIQRAAKFRITAEQEIGHQMRQRGFDPQAVKYVILTHLHQDHDGGLHHFPNAEFIVSREEWNAAKGITGRLGGYLNQRWATFFQPTLINFEAQDFAGFPHSHELVDGITLVPTPGHSAGHLSVIVRSGDYYAVLAGDMAYSEHALQHRIFDGVTADLDIAKQTMEQMSAFLRTQQAIFMPSHDPQSAIRLEAGFA